MDLWVGLHPGEMQCSGRCKLYPNQVRWNSGREFGRQQRDTAQRYMTNKRINNIKLLSSKSPDFPLGLWNIFSPVQGMQMHTFYLLICKYRSSSKFVPQAYQVTLTERKIRKFLRGKGRIQVLRRNRSPYATESVGWLRDPPGKLTFARADPIMRAHSAELQYVKYANYQEYTQEPSHHVDLPCRFPI